MLKVDEAALLPVTEALAFARSISDGHRHSRSLVTKGWQILQQIGDVPFHDFDIKNILKSSLLKHAWPIGGHCALPC
jgi:hypothetical protein